MPFFTNSTQQHSGVNAIGPKLPAIWNMSNMPNPSQTAPNPVVNPDTSVAWWPTASAILGALGAIAALSLTIHQIRLARKKLRAERLADA